MIIEVYCLFINCFILVFSLLNIRVNFDKLVQSVLQQQKDKVLHTEGALKDVGHTVLSLAGLIPGVGEAFDLTNTIWYLRDREYLNAALSLISCIPVIGDIVGKGTMVSNFLAKLARYMKNSGSVGRVGAEGVAGARRIIVQASPVVIRLKSRLKEHKTRMLIKAIFNKAKQHDSLRLHVEKMQGALDVFLKS
jgi:hypothetical protein